MLHPKRVLMMSYYALRKRVRLALGIPPRHRPPPVLGQAFDAVIDRHRGVVKALLEHIPAEVSLRGKVACEVGSGDCLAVASAFLGLGARRVEIVEVAQPVVNEKQVRVLTHLKEEGLPGDPSMIQSVGGYRVDSERVHFQHCFMENVRNAPPIDFMYSFSVLEHVEDLDGFFKASHRLMPDGAFMVHAVDLGGHDLFEDPLPPLDFQTYPDWLYRLMFPLYHRATRRFLNDYLQAAERNGFVVVKTHPIRRAEPGYLEQIWPKLRPQARLRPKEEVGIIEFAMVAQKANRPAGAPHGN